MEPSEIMSRLEQGSLDIDDALALFGDEASGERAQDPSTASAPKTTEGSPTGASGEDAIRWSAPGKLRLRGLNEAPPSPASHPTTPTIRLSPLSLPSASPAHPPVRPSVEPAARAPKAPSPPPKRPAVRNASPAPTPPAPAAEVRGAERVEEVVHLRFPEPGIAVVAIEDREHRNMFSPSCVRGLLEAFDRIHRSPQAKVVVVHGYGTWFSSGGTPGTLQEIRDGQKVFTDTRVFRVMLDCDLPTISAISGHALGGGMTFGLYGDILLFAEHSFYAGNFMEHGFTPGVGATFLFPDKLGSVLGSEMLLSARRYRGAELRDRGAQVQVHPADQVIPQAMEIARGLASKPIPQLKLLKRRLSQRVRRGVEDAIQEELMMHRVIFSSEGWVPR